jgi:hypothetical protein
MVSVASARVSSHAKPAADAASPKAGLSAARTDSSVHMPSGEPCSLAWTDAYTVDGVRRLAEQGVTDVIVGFRWPYQVGPDTEPLEHKINKLRRFADSVIAKMPA